MASKCGGTYGTPRLHVELQAMGRRHGRKRIDRIHLGWVDPGSTMPRLARPWKGFSFRRHGCMTRRGHNEENRSSVLLRAGGENPGRRSYLRSAKTGLIIMPEMQQGTR